MENSARIIRVTLAIVVLSFCFGLFILFPNVGFLPCCLLVLGLPYLFLQIYSAAKEKPLVFRTLLVPLGIMAGSFLICMCVDGAIGVMEAQPRIAITNQLKQIGLALHAYKDEYGSFPPAVICDSKGKPLYSWRVAILPFLEGDHLYAKFHLDEAWDSPHNFRLLDQIPSAFRPPKLVVAPDPSATFYQAFVGPGAAFEGNKGLTRADFGGDFEETIFVVEAREAVPWTKPVDIAFAPDEPLPDLGSPRRRRLGILLYGECAPYTFCAAMGDGHVESFEIGISRSSLRELVARNGLKKLDKNKEEPNKDKQKGG